MNSLKGLMTYFTSALWLLLLCYQNMTNLKAHGRSGMVKMLGICKNNFLSRCKFVNV